jgi:hypothetical protein
LMCVPSVNGQELQQPRNRARSFTAQTFGLTFAYPIFSTLRIAIGP